MKILKIEEDVTAAHESYDEKIKAIQRHIQDMHLGVSKDGKSYAALLEKGGGQFRLIQGANLEDIVKYIQDTTDAEGWINAFIITVHTNN